MKGATGQAIDAILSDVFQSTLPMKGATGAGYRCHSKRCVSIHAPNEGSDKETYAKYAESIGFNPRSQ